MENTNTNVNSTPPVDTPTPEPSTPEASAPRATRKPRVKPRSIEEILNTKPSKLTEAEKLLYIEYLQNECNKYRAQAECYKNNAELALRKANHFEGALKEQEDKYYDIQQVMSVAYKSINNIIKETK